MTSEIEIVKASIYDWDSVIDLAWRTFLKFEAAEYGAEGIKSFRDFLAAPMLKRMFILGDYVVFAAKDGEKYAGMISLRNKKHISLLFVEEAYHRKGIGRKLILEAEKYIRSEYGEEAMTVNAAPYAVEFYHKLQFVDVAPQMSAEGITYTPMERVFG